jgi:hypothetical protein
MLTQKEWFSPTADVEMMLAQLPLYLRDKLASEIPYSKYSLLDLRYPVTIGGIYRKYGADLAGSLIRCVGNPFKRIPVESNWFLWNDGVVMKLVDAIHEKNFDVMPILADALIDAGCDYQPILQHCRDNHHLRCCWVWQVLKAFCNSIRTPNPHSETE